MTRALRWWVALRRPDLPLRLYWLSVGPLLVFALLGGSYVVQQRYVDLSTRAIERTELLTRQLAVAVDYGLFSANQAALQSLAQSVLDETGVVFVQVSDASGLPVVALGNPGPADSRAWLPERVVREASVQTPLLPIDESGFETPDRTLAPLLLGKVRVELDLRPVRDQLSSFVLGVLGVLVLVVGAALWLVGRFTRRISQRVNDITQAARRIGAGESAVRLREQGMGTLDALVHSINRMASQLEIDRSELQRRIDQATAALRAQRDAARQADGAKTRFLASASHDLRQPLQALGMLVNVLELECARSPEPQRDELVERISEATRALAGLVDALLDISRLDAGGVKVVRQDVELNELILRVCRTFEPLAIQKGIELQSRYTPAVVRTDPDLLERIVANLVSNAVRYTPPGGRVLVAVRWANPYECVIQVRDSGPGIAVEHQQRIFDEFVQLHNPQRDRSQGLGLGLPIVQRLCRLLDHPLSLRSAAGCGATFSLRVPRDPVKLSSRDTVVRRTPTPAPAVGGHAGAPQLLVIENDPLVLQAYRHLLGLWGVPAVLVDSAQAALEVPLAGIQGVLTDFRLGPERDGLQLARELQGRCTQRLRVAIVTGDTENRQLRSLDEADLQVVFKPVATDRLLEAVNWLIRA